MLYKTEALADLFDVTPPPYLVEGLIRKHTLTLFSSEPHVGKTMFMLYLAMCMENKIKVLDTFDVLINTSSIFIGVDSPRWDIAVQAQKIKRGLGLTDAQVAMMDSRILPRGVKPKPDIMDPNFLDWLKELTDTYQTDTIFIDTIRRVHHRNENDSSEMSEVMERLEEFVDKGRATIIMSTHTSKPIGVERSSLYSVRGSTVIAGSADFHYSMGLNKKGQIVFDGTSKRRGENRAKGYMLLEYVEKDGGLKIQVIEEDAVADPTQELVFKALTSGPKTAPQLVSETNGSYWAVQKALRSLRGKGRIKKVERGLWSLASL